MSAVAPVPRICGREAEIQALGAALGRVAAGRPEIVLVEGEAGIGKTRLLAHALRGLDGETEELGVWGRVTVAAGETISIYSMSGE